MQEWWLTWVLIFFLVVIGLGAAWTIFYYLREALSYRFSEFVACLFSVFLGASSYAVARYLGLGFGLEQPWAGVRAVIQDPVLWFVVVLGAASALLFAQQLARWKVANFRWVLVVLCWSVAVVLELAIALIEGGQGTRAFVLGSVYIIAMAVVAMLRIPGRRPGTVVPQEENDEDHQSSNPERTTPRPSVPEDPF